MFLTIQPFLSQPLLREGVRDLFTLLSVLLTIIGLGYAIWQIRKTKDAANAAREAAERASQESQKNFNRYTAANAHRHVSEVKIFVGKQDWSLAARCLSDLAYQAALLGGEDAEWTDFASQLRQWEYTCSRLALGLIKRFAVEKWGEFINQLQAKIDRHSGPFPTTDGEFSNDN